MSPEARVTDRPEGTRDVFHRFARSTSEILGSSKAFVAAIAAIVIWGATGPLFGFSDTWQLVVNTTTTIVTFLMVFLLQNTQNRDGQAVQLKLDELVRAIEGARNSMVDIENLSDEQLKRLQEQFARMRSESDEEDDSPREPPVPDPEDAPISGR